MSSSNVWLITGTSTGFGRALAEYAISKGYKVVATSRNIDKIKDIQAANLQNVLTVKLDVTKSEDIKNVVAAAMNRFGRIDVLINNAGIVVRGAVEEVTEELIRKQFDTNFFGAIAVTREVLPILRNQGTGAIVQISSLAGTVAFPMSGIYAASKFALDGISESLQKEVAPFGIKVMIVKPGYFNTSIIATGTTVAPKIEAYDHPLLQQARHAFESVDLTKTGDPYKAAKAIDFVLQSENTPLRLLLGEDALLYSRDHDANVAKEYDTWENVTLDTKMEY